MTGQSKQDEAPSFSYLGEKISRILKNKLPSTKTEFPNQDIPDWKIQDFPEDVLMDSVDSIDSTPRRPLLHWFDSGFSYWFRDTKPRAGQIAALGASALMYANFPEAYVDEPEFVSLAYGLGSALVATGAVGYHSKERYESGKYDGRLYNNGEDLRRGSPVRNRDPIRRTLYNSPQVAVSFLDDTLDRYRDRVDLNGGGEFVDFLKQEESKSENLDLWLSKDEEDPIWTLHVEGTYEDGEDYKMVATGINPEYETEEIEPKTYDQILEELSGDNYRDFAMQEDTGEIEKKLRAQS